MRIRVNRHSSQVAPRARPKTGGRLDHGGPRAFNTPVQYTLTGKFLLASQSLLDPNFVKSVVLVVRHDAEGAFGLIVNRPMPVSVGQTLGTVIEEAEEMREPVYFGGPCQGPVFVMHTDLAIGGESPVEGVYLTTDREAIEALLASSAEPVKFFGSYSGWSPAQLEAELIEGSWIVTDATPHDIFAPGEDLWQRINSRIDLAKFIDPSKIPDDPSVN